MIIGLFLNFIADMVAIVFSIVPQVTLADILIIGEPLTEYLYIMMGYWNTFEIIFPYVAIVKDVFVIVIIPFELTLILIKFFFGSRTPING